MNKVEKIPFDKKYPKACDAFATFMAFVWLGVFILIVMGLNGGLR